MTLLRSVVGKLWMTIIALVAVVLIILGLFLFPIIDATFPDQAGNLQNMADKLSRQIPSHLQEKGYVDAIIDLLESEEASVNLISLDHANPGQAAVTLEGKQYHLGDIFNAKELGTLQAGKKVSASFSITKDAGDGGKYLAIASPMLTAEGGTGSKDVLLLFQSKKSLENTQNYVKWLFALVSIAGFLLTTFFAFFLIYKINRPLLELKRIANHFIRGEYGSRVPVMSRDEIGELGTTFNLMGEQLEETIRDLSHQKENLASVLRSMADAVISFDVDGRIIFMNPEGESLLVEWSDLHWDKGANEEESEVHEPAAYQLIPEPLQAVFQQVVKETKEIATKVHVKDGVWSLVMAPLYSEDMVRGAVVVLRDVTEEYRLDKLRIDFVANVSHELRTPLSMLQGYSEALIDDIASTPEERQELAQIIYDESLRMGRLVRDLLDLAKMETGNLEYHFHDIDIGSFLRRIHRKFSAYCKEHDIQLELELDEDVKLFAKADEDRLEQVLTNLLDNAVRHTPSGAAIHLTAGLSILRGDRAVFLEVRDEGQGIPAEDLSYIFERFYKADKARTRGSSGTGLGLAIAKNIVDAHKGSIQVKSKVGQGTTFTLQLPLA
ncbi:ATP-binding protein [Gorillibacterium massiliense]|uniref:ATP-binding protein n=1 Tax=Gorillibacterium massiliense TaxID=1280390 RepID=UPI0004B0ED18|nr:ATP-binding protein [Gorillibacterium massiliense]